MANENEFLIKQPYISGPKLTVISLASDEVLQSNCKGWPGSSVPGKSSTCYTPVCSDCGS